MSYVLLVEDNQATADMIIRVMNSAGLEVRHFTRSLDGAKMARQERPAIILMDFNLPDIDGRTMVLILKKQLGGHSAPPVVAVTARTGESEEYLAKSFGCDAFVNKPFIPEDLLKLVQELIQRDAAKLASGIKTKP
jgi:DNA-binding response OmpR family regulator